MPTSPLSPVNHLPGTSEVRDPKALRALAHPTRLALLEILTAEGEATATRCAELLNERVASCSFHLRTLAKHGFIERVPGLGREKPWRVTTSRQRISEQRIDHEQRLAVEAFADFFIDNEFARLRAWQRQRTREPAEWREAATMIGSTVWVTAEELRHIGEEVEAIAIRYSDRDGDSSRRPSDSRLARLFIASSLASTGGDTR